MAEFTKVNYWKEAFFHWTMIMGGRVPSLKLTVHEFTLENGWKLEELFKEYFPLMTGLFSGA